MSDQAIPNMVRDFVFEYIDSVEQLEILLLLQSNLKKSWSAAEINSELRSNLNSIEKRLSLLAAQGLIKKNEEGKHTLSFDEDLSLETIRCLADFYKIHRYKILELIFSPMKRSRDLADAFRISTSKPNKGDDNG